MKTPIAVQLYSVHKDCQQDLPGTLRAVAEMGYDGVELAGLHDHPAAEWKQMLTDYGLRVEGAHIGRELLLPDAFNQTLDTYAELGCRRLIVPWIGGDAVATADGWPTAGSAFSRSSIRPPTPQTRAASKSAFTTMPWNFTTRAA